MANRIPLVGLLVLLGLGDCCWTAKPCAAQEPLFTSLSEFFEEGDDVLKRGRTGQGEPLPKFTFERPDELRPPTEMPPVPEPSAPGLQWRLRHRGAHQVGQPVSYTTLGAFAPLLTDDGLWFVDGQFLLDNNGDVGGNLGAGRRWYDSESDRLFGASLWYDVRGTQFSQTFHQLGLSLESLGDRWDVRGNFYAPVSDPVRTGPSQFGPLFFQDSSLARTVTGLNQAALKGADVELATRIGDFDAWIFGGAYHYQRAGQQIYGATGGARGFLTPNVATEVGVTNDAVFNTNVVFAVTLFLPGGTRSPDVSRRVYNRIGQPVQRNYAVAVSDMRTPTSVQVLNDPGGTPLHFVHVNSAAAPGGTGTLTAPFQTLAAVQAASNPNDILLAHSGSNFSGESITLQSGQQFLGEGIDHFVMTQQAGLVQLPSATGGNTLPIIAGAPGDAITMASDSAVSGFVINIPGGRGVSATNLTGNVIVSHVQVNNATTQGIFLENIHGRVSVDQSTVNVSGNQGLLLSVTNLLSTDATITNNLFTNNAAPGFLATNTGPANSALRLNLSGNDSTQGFGLLAQPGTVFDLGGPLGQGMTFTNSDNGNVAANGNTSNSGPPTVNVSGDINIVNPTSIPAP